MTTRRRIRTAGDTDQSGVISRLRATCGPGCRCKSCCPTTKCPTGPTGPAGGRAEGSLLLFTGLFVAGEGGNTPFYLANAGRGVEVSGGPDGSQRYPISDGQIFTLIVANVDRDLNLVAPAESFTIEIVYRLNGTGAETTALSVTIPAGTSAYAPVVSSGQGVVPPLSTFDVKVTPHSVIANVGVAVTLK